MAFEVRIPTLGESVNEGVIVRWAKQDGDTVGPDDILLELETDKAATELAADHPGVLRILKQVGETVSVKNKPYAETEEKLIAAGRVLAEAASKV